MSAEPLPQVAAGLPPALPSHASPDSPSDPAAATAETGTRHGDLVAGGLFVVVGLAFAVRSVDYDLGTWRQLGAGMFPFVLGLVTAGLGVGVVVTGLRGGERTAGLSRLPWRGLVCVLGAVVWFAFTVRTLGLVPAAAGTVLLSCLASPTTSLLRALGATVGITAACYVIFVLALQLRLPLFA